MSNYMSNYMINNIVNYISVYSITIIMFLFNYSMQSESLHTYVFL